MFGEIFLVGLLTAAAPPAAAEYRKLGGAVANEVAQLQPGEVVVIEGNAYTVPMMESIAIAARNAGARPVMVLHTDKEVRAERMETPTEHLAQRDPIDDEWLASTDVWIGLPDVENAEFVSNGNDESRASLMASAYAEMSTDLTKSETRDVIVYWPSAHDAKSMGLPLERVRDNVSAGMSVTPVDLKAAAAPVRQALTGNRKVTVNDGNGGRLTFETGDRNVFVNTGTTSRGDDRYYDRSVTLPSGAAFASALETSATGSLKGLTIYCAGKRYDDVSIEVRDGRITNLKGSDCMSNRLAQRGGDSDRFGGWQIGVNPAMKKIVESDGGRFVPDVAAGVLTLWFGRNELTEGENSAGLTFGFTLADATVTVDGKKVIDSGSLTL